MIGQAAATLLALLALGGALSGCAASRTQPPDLSRPLAPQGSTPRGFPYLGLEFRSAANWSYETGRPPLVAMMSSGQAVVAIWRYPRAQALPRGLTRLRAARHALVLDARSRDPTFTARQGRILRVAGVPAIDLVGQETVQGRVMGLRSLHAYAHGAEFVVDAIAPAGYFPAIDASLFVPLLGTLRFPVPVPAAPAYAAALTPPPARPGIPATARPGVAGGSVAGRPPAAGVAPTQGGVSRAPVAPVGANPAAGAARAGVAGGG